ncbi:MAG TPA: hypothetical protein VH853_13785 [Polyangia bacterium]|jgi:hypothetical protein|nr:hypothetical protein [Polyangia bacterium]
MARPFVTEFLLPLVRGGALRVGRPLGARAVARVLELVARAGRDAADEEAEPIAALGAGRRAVAGRLFPAVAAPPLDEVSVRLGAALHDLLALAHPDLAGPGLGRRQEQIAAAALELASIGPPPSAREAVNRHSLLARLPEIARVDRTVKFWLGRQTFVGRTPPGRIMALPSLRRVRVERSCRGWLREIGIPAVGRRAFLALNVASPLGEALDPLRLDPPLGWGRVLPVLRFPGLARAVAGAAVELGVDRAGDALAGALYRYAGMHDPPFGLPATGESVAFALRFLAHLVWLDVLYGADPDQARAAQPAHNGPELGLELAVVLTAAARTRPSLVWPDDVPPGSDLGRAFGARLALLDARASAAGSPRLAAALSIADYAAAPVTRPLAL